MLLVLTEKKADSGDEIEVGFLRYQLSYNLVLGSFWVVLFSLPSAPSFSFFLVHPPPFFLEERDRGGRRRWKILGTRLIGSQIIGGYIQGIIKYVSDCALSP